MQEIRQIEMFLREWDPIGVLDSQVAHGIAPTEYDSYAPAIRALLRRHCSRDELQAYLHQVRVELMGLRSGGDDDVALAERLLKWWKGRGASTT